MSLREKVTRLGEQLIPPSGDRQRRHNTTPGLARAYDPINNQPSVKVENGVNPLPLHLFPNASEGQVPNSVQERNTVPEIRALAYEGVDQNQSRSLVVEQSTVAPISYTRGSRRAHTDPLPQHNATHESGHAGGLRTLGAIGEGIAMLGHIPAEVVIYPTAIALWATLNTLTVGKFRKTKLTFTNVRNGAVTGLKSIPFIGNAAELIEAMSGRTLGSFERMSTSDRLWALAVAATALIPGVDLIPASVYAALESSVRAGRSAHKAISKAQKARSEVRGKHTTK